MDYVLADSGRDYSANQMSKTYIFNMFDHASCDFYHGSSPTAQPLQWGSHASDRRLARSVPLSPLLVLPLSLFFPSPVCCPPFLLVFPLFLFFPCPPSPACAFSLLACLLLSTLLPHCPPSLVCVVPSGWCPPFCLYSAAPLPPRVQRL